MQTITRHGRQTMAQLADVFKELIAKHDIHYLGVSINAKMSDESLWGAVIQWDGFTRAFNCCVIEHGPTPEQAIAKALGSMIVARTPLEVEPVIELEIGEAA